MNDELDEPLGWKAPQKKPARPAVSGKTLAGVGVLLASAAVAALIYLPHDPYGGEPHAIARIEPAKEPVKPSTEAPTQENARNDEAAPERGAGRDQVSSADVIERQSGVKVTRPSGAEGSGALIIQIDPPSGIKLPAAPDRRVSEKGPYGVLPKIGADGAKPLHVYARPFVPSPKLPAGAPRLALVVGGVGLNPTATAAAIDELPESVTLALAPYGANIDATAQRARERGHEILLQAPMEPFDYEQNNPGPHTLLTGEHGGDNLDDLRWLMSRFSGYAGVMNFLGARFTADEKAFAPVLGELAERGLLYVDDGTSPQSLATTLAPRQSLPFAHIDIVLDAKQTPQAIDAALTQLEALARQKGAAIGFANALPATISRLSRFSRDLERRGVALAPVSATLGAATPPATKIGSPK